MVPGLLTALFTLAATAPDSTRAQDRVEQWQEDILHVVGELDRLHPDAYFGIPEEEFEAAVDRLLEKIPDATDDEVVVGLMELVALVSRKGRDGHTAVWPGGFRLLPLQFYRFSDGWFVVRAHSSHADLEGARLVGIGDVAIEDACERIAPYLTRDNDANLLAKTPMMLLGTEFLHAVGITSDRSRTPLVLEGSDGAHEVELPGQTVPEYARWNTFPPQNLPADEDVRWLRQSGGPFWMDVLEDEESLYVHYGEIRSDDGEGNTLADFAGRLVGRFDAEGLERVIVDVRGNRGGDNTTFHPLIEALRTHDAINRRGALFVLTGRATFSAAGNFVTSIQARTNAILVGEPTGGAPNQYGDARQVSLPNHRDVMVFISTRYHEFGGPDDQRLTHEPDVPVAYSSEDYFQKRDPVLEAALRFAD